MPGPGFLGLLITLLVGQGAMSPCVLAAGPEALQATTPVNVLPEKLTAVGFIERLGKKIDPAAYRYRNEAGEVVPLSSYFSSGKPVILSFAYYNCPTLCSVVLNGVLEGLKGLRPLGWIPGKQFEVVNVSIDPKETPAIATEKKNAFLEAFGTPEEKAEAGAGWHFLTAEESQIKALASELGFGYRYDEKQQEYVHGAGIFILTPDGTISRILYGIQYRPTDLKLSLLEASNGKVGTIIDRILLFCYSYDPQMKQYSLVLQRVMQVGALFTVLLLGAYLGVFWWRQRKRSS